MSLPRGGLSISKDSAIVSTEHICKQKTKQNKRSFTKTPQSLHLKFIFLFERTLHDLLGAGVVNLLLGGVGWKHSIERVRLPLKQKVNNNKQLKHH